MNILLIGSSGFIGTYIKKQLIKNYDVDCPSSLELDITNEEHIKKFLKNKNYDYIILSAACKDINKLQNNEDYAYKINTEPLNNFVDLPELKKGYEDSFLEFELPLNLLSDVGDSYFFLND